MILEDSHSHDHQDVPSDPAQRVKALESLLVKGWKADIGQHSRPWPLRLGGIVYLVLPHAVAAPVPAGENIIGGAISFRVKL